MPAALLTAGAHDLARLHVTTWTWLLFTAVIVALLIIDLAVLHRRTEILSTRRAALESVVWLLIGVTFGIAVIAGFGGQAGGEWFSGYLIELSLSVDNVFVWALILTSFVVPRGYQHRVLFWGVFGAVTLRAGFIFAGVALIDRFHWALYIFGVFLIYTAGRLVIRGTTEFNPNDNVALRLVRRFVRSTDEYDGARLFVKRDGRRLATPLFAVLVLVEATDVLFAVDSVPAVLAVSREAFIVLSSNAFAILGLRSVYFLLADLHARFAYLQHGIAVILAFVGGKMLAEHWYTVPVVTSLLVIAIVLTVSIAASLRWGPARPLGGTAEPIPPGER